MAEVVVSKYVDPEFNVVCGNPGCPWEGGRQVRVDLDEDPGHFWMPMRDGRERLCVTCLMVPSCRTTLSTTTVRGRNRG